MLNTTYQEEEHAGIDTKFSDRGQKICGLNFGQFCS